MEWPDLGQGDWSDRTVESWEDFKEIILEIQGNGAGVNGQRGWSFRGQADASWDLKPSLARHLDKMNGLSPYDALEIERDCHDVFLEGYSAGAGRGPMPNRIEDKWALMQNYGVPTRLLDWTFRASVATYFAVCQQEHLPGAIFCIYNPQVMHGASFFYQYGFPHATTRAHPPNLFETDRTKRPALYLSLSPWVTRRMYAQEGHFTYLNFVLGDHAQALHNVTSYLKSDFKILKKIVIPASLKMTFLQRLHEIGVSGQTVFLDLDGLGMRAREKVRIRSAGVAIIPMGEVPTVVDSPTQSGTEPLGAVPDVPEKASIPASEQGLDRHD